MTKSDIDLLLQEVKRLRRNDKHDAALELLNKALQENADARLFDQRASTFEQMEQREKAVQDLTSAIGLDNTNAEYFFDRGRILSGRPLGREEEAIHNYEEALRLDPHHFLAHCLCCGSLLILGLPDRALEHAEAALRLAPREPNSHYYLGECYMSLKRYKEAAESFRKAVELDPSSPDNAKALSRAIKGLNKVEAETMRKLIEEAFRKNHAATVVVLASRWLKTHPEDIWTMFKYAETLWAITRYEEATRVYEDALVTFPDHRWAIFNQLGRMCDYRGRLSEAEQWFRKAIEVEPDEIGAYVFLGSCQARQGKLEEAEATHRAATKWTAHSLLGEAYHNLGLVLRGQGRLNDAAECFRKAIEITPRYSEAIEALADVEAAKTLDEDNLAKGNT